MTRAKRDVIEREITAEGRVDSDPLTKRRPVRWLANAGLVLLAALIIVAWVLFFLGLAG